MRKISLQNKNVHRQLKLLTLTSRVPYSKPLINSFRFNLSISSTMNIQENELSGAQTTASNEANAADAAMELELVENSEGDASEVDSLIDYNEVDDEAAKAEQKAAEQKALREMLANNGFALREMLRSEKVKAHFTSPFARENTMSI